MIQLDIYNQSTDVEFLKSVYIEVCNIWMVPPRLVVLTLQMESQAPCNYDNAKRERNARNPGRGISRLMRRRPEIGCIDVS